MPQEMLKLDHITVIAPSLAEGVLHVRNCLDLDIPFGQRHAYMGTYNHLLQLGDTVYLEVVALDPEADAPDRRRWFGLDDQDKVRSDWEDGRRLRGWVARTMRSTQSYRPAEVSLERRSHFQLSTLPLTSPFRTTARSLSTGRLPRSSTGVGSLARWPQLRISVRDWDPSPSNIRILLPSRRCIAHWPWTARPKLSRVPGCVIARTLKRPPDQGN